jgi:hypothetical protein
MLERIDKLLSDNHLQATAWERGFLESIHGQASKNVTLSQPQVDILKRVENKNTQEQRNLLEEWLSKWDSERAEIAKVVALYYSSDGYYFQGLCNKVLVEKKPLSPGEYKKLCENKYATKVIEEHFKEPRFQPQEIVCVRSKITANKNYYTENGCYLKIENMHAVVLEVNALPVKRAAIGAKVYKILPFGSQKPYYVSESDLKKSKKIKK